MSNGSNFNEEHSELLKSLGEETIKQIFFIMGNKKFTIKPIIDHIKAEKIEKAFVSTNKPITEIAKENKVSCRTVYYKIKKLKSQNTNPSL